MIQNLTELIAIFIAMVGGISLVLFLPAFFELKKPKDRGPRVIPEITLSIPSQNSKTVFPLVDIDDEQKCGILLLHRIANILFILPNLEV